MLENEGSTLLSETEEAAWELRHREIGSKRRLAGLFRGWAPKGYARSKCRVLYVGKATSHAFDGDEPERRSFNGGGQFWRFARQLAEAIGCYDPALPCIAWSNISKLSTAEVNADRSLIDGFTVEAAATLESEILKTDPHIVVLVTNHFNDDVVFSIANTSDSALWNKSENESVDARVADIWWTRRRDGKAVLWMRHPQGANSELKAYAAAKVASLC